MKKFLSLVATAAVMAAGASAMSGGDCCGKSGGSGDAGYNCQNMCPLAKSANEHRSYGSEGSAVQSKALASQVQKNLAKI